MPGANAVLKRALGRTRPYPSGSLGHRRGTIRDGSGSLTDANAPHNHLASGGTTGIVQHPTSKDQGRSFQTFGKTQ